FIALSSFWCGIERRGCRSDGAERGSFGRRRSESEPLQDRAGDPDATHAGKWKHMRDSCPDLRVNGAAQQPSGAVQPRSYRFVRQAENAGRVLNAHLLDDAHDENDTKKL